jgi:hypothetical protein
MQRVTPRVLRPFSRDEKTFTGVNYLPTPRSQDEVCCGTYTGIYYCPGTVFILNAKYGTHLKKIHHPGAHQLLNIPDTALNLVRHIDHLGK